MIAKYLKMSNLRIIITFPTVENTQTVYNFIVKGHSEFHSKEHVCVCVCVHLLTHRQISLVEIFLLPNITSGPKSSVDTLYNSLMKHLSYTPDFYHLIQSSFDSANSCM